MAAGRIPLGVVNSHDRSHCCNSILFISCRTKVVVGKTRARFVVGDMLSLRTISRAVRHTSFQNPHACVPVERKKKKDNPFHLQPMRKVNVKEREGLRDFILFSFFPLPNFKCVLGLSDKSEVF